MAKQKFLKTMAVVPGTKASEFKEDEVQYNLADNKTVHGYGAFFKNTASMKIIDTYWEDLKKEEETIHVTGKKIEEWSNKKFLAESGQTIEQFLEQKAKTFEELSRTLQAQVESNLDKKTVAVEVGREMLLMILSQPRCEGIRFYEARGVKVTTDGDDVQIEIKDSGETTLVAVGIDAKGNDLDIKTRDTDANLSIMTSGVNAAYASMQAETNPPKNINALRAGRPGESLKVILDNFTSF